MLPLSGRLCRHSRSFELAVLSTGQQTVESDIVCAALLTSTAAINRHTLAAIGHVNLHGFLRNQSLGALLAKDDFHDLAVK